MNFNLGKKADYKLHHNLTDELINLYGVNVKLLLTEQINKDDLVFGDYSHLKTDSKKTFEIMCLPENSESWDDIGINFSDFGLIQNENIRLFFSRKTIDKVFGDFDSGKGFSDILGNLIVLPNNKIMEITDIEFEVPGINNLFTQSDRKNVYKITLVSYNNKLIQEAPDTKHNDNDADNYESLEKYFQELADEEVQQDTAAEVTPDENTGKVVLDTTEDSVFGRF